MFSKTNQPTLGQQGKPPGALERIESGTMELLQAEKMRQSTTTAVRAVDNAQA